MLKLTLIRPKFSNLDQPPSGGCVLKQYIHEEQKAIDDPAAFRRLCVETLVVVLWVLPSLPAAFRRLCVETTVKALEGKALAASRLQAAVC